MDFDFKAKFNELRNKGVTQDKVLLYCILEELVKLNTKLEVLETKIEEVEEKPEAKKVGSTAKK